MQLRNKEPDSSDESALDEMCLIVQVMDEEADMEQYSLETGTIVLSMPEEVSMEAMHCTGKVIPDKKPARIVICLQEFIADAPESDADDLEKTDLTYVFLQHVMQIRLSRSVRFIFRTRHRKNIFLSVSCPPK